MPKVERGQYSDLLRRYLGMTGTSHVADELAAEIAPVLVLEAESPDWQFLMQNRLMSCAFSIGPQAALTSTHRLRNPANSGVVAVITFASFTVEVTSPGTRAVLNLSRNVENGTDLASNTPTIARDTRYAGVNTSALIGSAALVAQTGNNWHSAILANDQPHAVPVAFVLTPGNQLEVGAAQTDVILRGAWHWTEKRLDVLEQR